MMPIRILQDGIVRFVQMIHSLRSGFARPTDSGPVLPMQFGRGLLIALCCVSGEVGACSTRDRPTDAELYERAHEIVVAKVTSTKLARFKPSLCGDDVEDCEYVRAEYTLVESIKGKGSRRGHVKDFVFGLGNCSLGVVVGWYYVFYVDEEHRLVSHPGGSFAVGPYPKPGELEALGTIRTAPHARPGDDD